MSSSPAARRRKQPRARWWLAFAAALAATVPAVAHAFRGNVFAARSSTATVYVSPSGSDARCVRGDAKRACATLGRAYAVARPGDTIVLRGGTYNGDQDLRFDPSKTASAITIAPAAGEEVLVNGSITFDGASHITIRGSNRLRVHSINADLQNGHRPSYLTIADLQVFAVEGGDPDRRLGGSSYLDSVDHLTLRHVEFGPTCCDLDGLDIAIARPGDPPPSNVVLDDVYIHDIELSCSDLAPRYRPLCHAAPTEEHVDCVQFFGGVNVTIENSRFFNCATSNVMTGSGNGGTFSNWTLQNNQFGGLAHPDNGVDLSDGGPGNSPWSGTIRVLHNTFADGTALIFGGGEGVFQPGTSAYVAGNAGGLTRLCLDQTENLSATFVANVWGRFKCGARDVVGSLTYIRETVIDPDLRPAPDSAVIAVVDPTIGPPLDARGAPRPRFVDADAGALQREPAGLTLGAAVGPVALGLSKSAVETAEGAPAKSGQLSGAIATSYSRFGGSLSVRYAGGKVVAIGTTSRYYSTPSGIAVGEPRSSLPAAAGWSPCGHGLQRAAHGNVVVVATRGNRIAAIWNARRTYADVLCKAGP